MDFESPIPVFQREAPQKTWSPPGQEDPENENQDGSQKTREVREGSETSGNTLKIQEINAQFFQRIEAIGAKILDVGKLSKDFPPHEYAIHTVYELLKWGDMLSNLCSLYLRMEAANKK